MVAIGTTIADSIAGVRLAEQYPNDPIYAAVGVHPTDSDLEEIHPAQLHALLGSKKIVGIGETGFDYFHVDEPEERDLQSDIFEQHILMAKENNLPLIIHCRDKDGVYEAYEDTATLLRRHQMSNFVMHCFSGRQEEAEIFLELGGMLSIAGIVTFPKSEALQQVAKMMPLDRMLIETDAPFLAPVPHRGKRNESIYVEETAKAIAELRGVSLEEIAQATTDNACRFFRVK